MMATGTTQTCYDAGYANGWRDCLIGKPELPYPLELSLLPPRLVEEIRTLMAHASVHDFNRYYTAYVDAYHSGYEACRREENHQSAIAEFTVELFARIPVQASDHAEAEELARQLVQALQPEVTVDIWGSHKGKSPYANSYDIPDTTEKETQQ